MALPMLKSLMTCLGATPFWPLLAWIIFVISSTLLIVGMAKIFSPFSWDDVETAADLRSALGTSSEAAVVVGVVSVFNLMMTERTLSYKTALRYRSCSPPFYGTKCCQPGNGKFANVMAAVCMFYPFVTLVLGWLAMLLSLIASVLFTVVATLLMAVSALVTSMDAFATSGVEAVLGVLNDDPINFDLNVTKLSAEITAHVSKDSNSVLHGGALVIVGMALFTLGQVIFLSSFTVTYAASDIALSVKKDEKAQLLPSDGKESAPPLSTGGCSIL